MNALEVHAATASRWRDLVELFARPGPRDRGRAARGPRTSACYCMFWRLPPAEYEAAFRERSLENVSGGPTKAAMAELVASGAVPGLLAYRAGQPVGWVSVSPRSQLVRLEHTTQLRSDDAPVDENTWSISCFYVHRSHARSGIGETLLAAAAAHAVDRGATAAEGYPVKAGSVDPYTGYDTMFAEAGFRLVRPGRGKGRALWRRDLRP